MTVHAHGQQTAYVLIYDPDPEGLLVPGHTLRLNEHELRFGLQHCNFTPGAILARRGKKYQVTPMGSLKVMDPCPSVSSV